MLSYLDDWLAVHHITIFYHQLDAQNSCLFTYNTLIKILYMLQAYPAHLQEVYVVNAHMQSLVSSLCKSELSKITVLKFGALLISKN